MKNGVPNIFILFFVAILFPSCSLLHYVPNGQNVPLFQEKGEIAANVALSEGEQYIGIELQSAYAISDHIGIQVNGMIWSAIDFSQGELFDIAPGYFFNVNDNIVFEIYGGYGKGNVYHVFGDNYQPFNAPYEPKKITYDRYFIQPGIGYTHKNIDFAFSTRFNMIDYYGHKPIYSVPDDNPLSFKLKQLNQFYTIDPAITLRFGWRHFKFQLQSVFLIPLLDEHRVFSNEYPAFYDRLNINLGLHFTFGGHFNPI